jgi:hypothetical protein
MSAERTTGPARTPDGLNTRTFFAWSNFEVQDVARSRMLGSCGWPASSRIERIVDWATARWLVQAQVLSQQDDQYAQSKLVSEPLEYWIRAWDSGKPATSHSAA